MRSERLPLRLSPPATCHDRSAARSQNFMTLGGRKLLKPGTELLGQSVVQRVAKLGRDSLVFREVLLEFEQLIITKVSAARWGHSRPLSLAEGVRGASGGTRRCVRAT